MTRSPEDRPRRPLDWGLLIATRDRPATLAAAVSLAVASTRRPTEVIVVDASADRRASAAALRDIVPPGIRLAHVPADVASLTVQRMQAVALARAEVVFLLDDDSFLYPDAAARIMELYEADVDGTLAGVQAVAVSDSPVAAPEARDGRADVGRLMRRRGILRWLLRRVFLFGQAENFIPYDDAWPDRPLPEAARVRGAWAERHFEGFRMTFRRQAVLAEPFETLLRAYCPDEDTDASYRISRLGALVTLPGARLHHAEAAGGRLKRGEVAELRALNQALFLRRHARNRPRARRAWWRLMAHRIAIEVVKDLALRHWSCPKARGTLRALGRARAVWAAEDATLHALYPALQAAVLGQSQAAASAVAAPATTDDGDWSGQAAKV